MDLMLANVYSQVAGEMAEVDQVIARCLTGGPNAYLLEAGSSLLKTTGKRLRPVLVLLAGKCCRGSSKRLVCLAAALELIHTASLVHDDIIDQAPLRRGTATANARWGNHVAVLLGDFFYAKALELAAPLGTRVNKGLAEIVSELVDGEFRQLGNNRRYEMTETEYLETVAGKTAKFIALCCRLGAELAKPPRPMLESLARYGFYAGMAYQITDDVLDVAGTTGKTGKSVGQDLLGGVITLPVIHALNTGTDRSRFSRLLAKERLTTADLGAIMNFIRQTGSIEYSMNRARDFISQARGSLQELPAGPSRDALDLLAEYICRRIS